MFDETERGRRLNNRARQKWLISEKFWPHQVALGFGGPAFILLYPSVPVRLVEGLVG